MNILLCLLLANATLAVENILVDLNLTVSNACTDEHYEDDVLFSINGALENLTLLCNDVLSRISSSTHLSPFVIASTEVKIKSFLRRIRDVSEHKKKDWNLFNSKKCADFLKQLVEKELVELHNDIVCTLNAAFIDTRGYGASNLRIAVECLSRYLSPEDSKVLAKVADPYEKDGMKMLLQHAFAVCISSSSFISREIRETFSHADVQTRLGSGCKARAQHTRRVLQSHQNHHFFRIDSQNDCQSESVFRFCW